MSRFRINLNNPVNLRHPLNIGRLAWWYWFPNSGQWGSTNFARDLLGHYPVTLTPDISTDPEWSVLPSGMPAFKFTNGAGSGGLGWNAEVPNSNPVLCALTDNFTVGCTVRPATITPSDLSGFATLMSAAHAGGDNAWALLQQYQKLWWVGSNWITSGDVLSTTEFFRIICVEQGGTGYIYLNGNATPIISGSVTMSASTSNLFFGQQNGARKYIGDFNDAFVSNRPWSIEDIQEDYRQSKLNYRTQNSPLNYLPVPRNGEENTAALVNFTTGIGVAPGMSYANPANFTTQLYASGTGTGLGPLVPDGPADFLTEIGVTPVFGAGEPTLVGYTTDIDVDQTADSSGPVEFTTGVGVSHFIKTIAKGNPRILSQDRFKR